MAMVENKINESMVGEFMTLKGWLGLPGKFSTIHDEEFGGHFIWDAGDATKAWEFGCKIYGQEN